MVETSKLIGCCDWNGRCCYCCDTIRWRRTSSLSYFDPCWIQDVGLRGRGSISINFCYSISRFFYITLAPSPTISGSDEATPPWCIRCPSNHLIGVDCGILMTRELVGATTTVVRRVDTVGPTIEFVSNVGFDRYSATTIVIVVVGVMIVIAVVSIITASSTRASIFGTTGLGC